MPRGNWTKERTATLKKLWIDGVSAGDIATQLGGVTRNAVIGKLDRSKLMGKRAKRALSTPRLIISRDRRGPARADQNKLKAAKLKKESKKPRVHLTPRMKSLADLVVPTSLHIALGSLTDLMCKWPIGDPASEAFHFCGHRNWNKLPYCEYHSRLAYQTSAERKAERQKFTAPMHAMIAT